MTAPAGGNRRVVLAAKPQGLPRESDFALQDAPMPVPGAGEVLVRGLWLSVDPYMRGLIAGVYPHIQPIEVGDMMRGGAAARWARWCSPAIRRGSRATWWRGAAAGSRSR